ncbi:3-ketoacyl-ACP reductase [Planctomicrobium piriforme]|uniref:NAD(P)-dependent dehydrogenase, short-chain alcohol dehydrogenase family n=1 Tax=Planctomicrobium piriforme TaxID=1576369 RepID=A0A1I3FHE2_9PLAN|nr:3-ketoacyl-ACP reductase [Planctomicrobium piriforme]SFI10321.1 NAD(P)-dependent dehydrogenase, short-chain alcohol dehydrogenase family [Planctomicrobium piriforme]
MPVAIITGGARGIGRGIAGELAKGGWNLMLNGMRPANQVQEALTELADFNVSVQYCAGDIGVAADRERLIKTTVEKFGGIDALINNAGITSPGRKDLLEAEEDSFDRVMAVNLKGPFFLTQLAARQMISQAGNAVGFRGTIVFVSSVSGEFVSTNRGDYCLSKAGLGMATKLWAARLAEYGIDVFEVRPGVIRSDMTSGVQEKYDKLIAEGLTLQRRWGEVEDVGKAVRALVSGQIPYATGQVLRIDGGMTIRTM